MAIAESTDDPKVIYHGTLDVVGEKLIKFETSPGGVEVINLSVPEGETYNISAHIVITKNG